MLYYRKGVIAVKTSYEAIRTVHKMSDAELKNRYFEIMNYIDSKGIDTRLILEVNAITGQLAMRDLNKKMGMS